MKKNLQLKLSIFKLNTNVLFGPFHITLEPATKFSYCPTKNEGVGSWNDFETRIDECQQITWVIIRAHIHFFNCRKVVRSLEEMNVYYRCKLAAFVVTIFLYFNTKIYLHQTCFMTQKINPITLKWLKKTKSYFRHN